MQIRDFIRFIRIGMVALEKVLSDDFTFQPDTRKKKLAWLLLLIDNQAAASFV